MIRLLLAFTWELPQTLLALICILYMDAKKFNLNGSDEYYGMKLKLITSKFLTCWSLGEWIFLNTRYVNYYGSGLEDEVIKHEYGHSRQSRILGPLYLILIAIPSTIWNMIARVNNKVGHWFYNNYYNTPWEHTADILGGIKRN